MSKNFYRLLLAALIAALAFFYTLAVLTGNIPPGQRIDNAHLAVLALVLLCIFFLMNPGISERLQKFELSGFKFEMLEKVKEKQAEQESRLEDIALILPLLLPEVERKHLLNLTQGKTKDYKGNGALRSELRRLRSVGLIKSLPQMHVGQIKDDSRIDLADYVSLTELGKRWVKRISEIENAENL